MLAFAEGNNRFSSTCRSGLIIGKRMVFFFFPSRILVLMGLCGRFSEEVVAYVALVSGPSLRKDLIVQDVGTTILVSK